MPHLHLGRMKDTDSFLRLRYSSVLYRLGELLHPLLSESVRAQILWSHSLLACALPHYLAAQPPSGLRKSQREWLKHVSSRASYDAGQRLDIGPLLSYHSTHEYLDENAVYILPARQSPVLMSGCSFHTEARRSSKLALRDHPCFSTNSCTTSSVLGVGRTFL